MSKSLKIIYHGKEYKESDYVDGFLIVDGVLVNVGDEAIKDGAIAVPEGVRAIASMAFCDCEFESVKLPDSLESIGEKAFVYCEQLKTVQFGNGLKTIGKDAFGHTGVISLKFPDSLESIGDWAFAFSKKLENVEFNEGLKQIGRQAFTSCKINNVSLPKSLKTQSVGCFSENPISSLVITDENQFGMATSKYFMQKFVIGGDVKRVDASIFEDYGTMHMLVFEDGVEEIDGRIASAKNIVFPKTLKKVSISSLSYTINPQDGVQVTDCLVIDSLERTPDSLKVGLTENTKLVFPDVLEPSVTDGINGYDLAKKQKLVNWIIKQKKYNPRFNDNYVSNVYNAFEKFTNKEIKFIPSYIVLSEMPAKYLDNFFMNGNDGRWGKIVSAAGFDEKGDGYKKTYIPDMFKLYYALGGFSEDESVSNKAYQFMTTELLPALQPKTTDIGLKISKLYGGIRLNDAYNPMFAGFVMKYFKGDPYFLSDKEEELNYFGLVHNSFKSLQEAYPYMGITGNTRNSLFTPEFMIKHCVGYTLENVDKGNEVLAQLVCKYGFDQHAFDEMQKVYNYAKVRKDTYVIKANKDDSQNPVTYNFLDKDDPNGFIIGAVTNCCQRFGGDGASCVDDGYINPNAGFLVFEQLKKDDNGNPIIKTDMEGRQILDANGNPVYEKQILGQAYIWYDEQSKTVCYDNIEIPERLVREFEKNEKSSSELKIQDLLDAVERSANAIMDTMNADGVVRVERVTTGEGHNDLVKHFKHYRRETSDILNRNSHLALDESGENVVSVYGYTDANNAQYVIATYTDTTDKLEKEIQDNIDEATVICSTLLGHTTNRVNL